MLELILPLIHHISDVDRDFFTEVLGDFLECEARGFREEEVDH